MIERRTVLDQVELTSAGFLGIRLAFLLVEGEVEIDRKWHRTAIPTDTPPAAQMEAVNNHLSIMEPPMPLVSQADIDFVVQCHALLCQHAAQLCVAPD